MRSRVPCPAIYLISREEDAFIMAIFQGRHPDSENTEATNSCVTIIRKQDARNRMTRLWRKNTIEDVAKGKCGLHIQADICFVAPSDMKAQINIRMTKIASRDHLPRYPIQDILQ
jgi:hypothetical protein